MSGCSDSRIDCTARSIALSSSADAASRSYGDPPPLGKCFGQEFELFHRQLRRAVEQTCDIAARLYKAFDVTAREGVVIIGQHDDRH